MNYKTIIKLMDIKTLVAGITPVLLGTTYSWYAFKKINFVFLVLLLIAMILIQSATNMINDYSDFKRGADDDKLGEEKAMVSGEIKPRQVLKIIIVYYSIALMIGVVLAKQTSYYILLVAGVAGFISLFYAVGTVPISYTPFGEVVSGITMGFGITVPTIFIQSGNFGFNTMIIGIPTSIFIGTILLSNNISDLKEDKIVGRKTLPILIGLKRAEILWKVNVISIQIITLIFVLVGIYPAILIIPLVILFPYRVFFYFSSYEKNIYTKGKTMGIIGQIGLRYHGAIIIGLIISKIIC